MTTIIRKSQVMADLLIELNALTSLDRAVDVVERALRSTGLTNATTLDERELQDLLAAVASEGGLIEQLARQIATHGLATSEDARAA